MQGIRRIRRSIYSLSIGPKRNTPERVQEFLGNFEGRCIGLIPDPSQLERLRSEYRLVARELKEPGAKCYDLEHTDFVYSVDSEGRFRHALLAGTEPEIMIRAIRGLLAEPK